MRLTVVGDLLLDRDVTGVPRGATPDAGVPVVDAPMATERPGGAGLAAVLGARAGAQVTLVAALSSDPAGQRLRALLAREGVAVAPLHLPAGTPVKERVLAGEEPICRLDRDCAAVVPGALTDSARAAIAAADCVLVSDYGRGVTARADVRSALVGRPVVWDPHPLGAPPVDGVRLATPNAQEAEGRDLSAAEHVAVTCGAEGARLDGALVPAEPASGDPCGAGDCFAVSAAIALGEGASTRQAVERAVSAATGFVAAGGAGALELAPAPERAVTVATGGCFDLLHAGHVELLAAARAHGDRLVVLLNSDASVRRLKGETRPVVPEEDRAAVLRGLAAVDDVVIFDEDEPSAALERLRPDVWVKGADYEGRPIAESAVLERIGARTAFVALTPGRSTTRLIEEAMAGGH